MTATELVKRFPEIPPDLHDDPVLARFAETFDSYLQTASKPSACSGEWTLENRAYMTLVGPMDIYRYGLSTREKVIAQLDGMMAEFETSADAFEKRIYDRVES